MIGTATSPDGAASIEAYLKEAGNAGAGMALTQVLRMIEARFDVWRPDHHV